MNTGRPLKYRELIENLSDETPYSPAAIINEALSAGVFQLTNDKQADRNLRIKVRHTLARFAKNHGFPFKGDETLVIPGQAPTPAWHGSRWKEALPPKRDKAKGMKKKIG